MRKEAREKATQSGELRRGVHGNSLSLSTIAEQAGIPRSHSTSASAGNERYVPTCWIASRASWDISFRRKSRAIMRSDRASLRTQMDAMR